MPISPIFMDYQSTTPVDPRVLDLMLPYFGEKFGNAASRTHAFGTDARNAVDEARKQIAALIGAKEHEIIFSSGATESNNLAIKGSVAATNAETKHIITQKTEHKSVLDSCRALEAQGVSVSVSYLDVDETGRLDPETIRRALRDDTLLISIMLSNNEIGTLQDIPAIAEIAREHGVLLHCDAAQGLGYVPLDVAKSGVDLVSLSAHKIYGPKGVGALFVSKSVQSRDRLSAQIHGGGHERGLRSGTLNVAGVVGFGAAAELMQREGAKEAASIRTLRDQLEQHILNELEEVRLNGSTDMRHPGNSNLSFGYVEGAGLLLALNEVIAVSSGAACSSATPEPSYVLQALGLEKSLADASIRYGIGRFTTEEDIACAAEITVESVRRLREKSELWRKRS